MRDKEENEMYIEWRVIYASNGWPTILCSIKRADGMEVIGVGTGHDNFNKSSRTVHDEYTRLTQAVKCLQRDFPAFLLDEIENPISLDLILEQLPVDRYSSEGLMATSIASHRFYGLLHGLTLYEVCAQRMNKEDICIPLPFFQIERLQNEGYTDFFLIPISAKSYQEALHAGMQVYSLYKENFLSFHSEQDVLEVLTKSLKKTEKELGIEFAIGIDWHAHTKYDVQEKVYKFRNLKKTSKDLLASHIELMIEYPILAWHNAFSALDIEGSAAWVLQTKKLRQRSIMQIGISNIHADSYELEYDALILEKSAACTIGSFLSHLLFCKEQNQRVVLTCGMQCAHDTWMLEASLSAGIDQVVFNDFDHMLSSGAVNKLLCVEGDLAL